MATQYTDILKLALPVQGELTGTWGTTVNDEITTMVEQAIAGLVTIDVWAADSHTLSIVEGAVSESRAAILRLTDTTVDLSGAGTLITPAQSKVYIVENNTGQVITIKTSAGTGVAIPNTKTGLVFCDGVNVEDGISYLPYSNATSGLTATTVQTAIDEVDADLDALTASLGTASTHNVTTSALDTTVASVLRVSDFGLGATLNPTLVDFAADNPSGLYTAIETDVLNFPATNKAGFQLMILCTNAAAIIGGAQITSYYVQRIAQTGTVPDPLDPSAGLPPPKHRSWNVSMLNGVVDITELLKVGDYGIGFLNYRASVDMNTTFVGGLYSYENTDVNRPNPTGTAGGSYVVNRHGISYFSQTAVDAGSGIMYNRITMADGVTWKAWREHATLAESDTRYLQLTGGTVTGDLTLTGDSIFSNGAFNVYSNSSNNPTFLKSWDLAGGTSLNMKRSRGTDIAPTSLVDNDTVGGIVGWAHDGTEYFVNTSIKYRVDGVTSTGVVPLEIIFETSETDTAGRTERLNIKADGKVGIGTATPATELDLVGDLTVSGAINLAGSVLENPIDYGIGVTSGNAVVLSSVDLDTQLDNGIFYCVGAINQPQGAGAGYLTVSPSSNTDYTKQKYTESSPTIAAEWFRTRRFGVWDDWVEFYHSGNSVNPLDFGIGATATSADLGALSSTVNFSDLTIKNMPIAWSTSSDAPTDGATVSASSGFRFTASGGRYSDFILQSQGANGAALMKAAFRSYDGVNTSDWFDFYHSGNSVNPLDYGLGDGTAPIITDFTAVIAAGHYRCTLSTVIGGPDTGAFSASVLVENAVDDGGQTFIVKRQTTNSANLLMWLGSRTTNSGAITWVEFYHSGNTNFDVFTSSVVGDVIAIGIGATTTTAIVHLPLVSNSAPTSLTIPAFTFKLSRMTDSVVVETGITAGDISLNALSSRRVAKLVISNCTGLVAGTAYELRTENTTSSITVVF